LCEIENSHDIVNFEYIDIEKLIQKPVDRGQFKVLKRLRFKNKVFYSSLYDMKHKRCSSFCKWWSDGKFKFGRIENFFKYDGNFYFSGLTYKNQIPITDFIDFSKEYHEI
jgi:hypothetical protein